MTHRSLYDRANGSTVFAGIIGTRTYAKAMVTQSASIERLAIPTIADLSIEEALAAYRLKVSRPTLSR